MDGLLIGKLTNPGGNKAPAPAAGTGGGSQQKEGGNDWLKNLLVSVFTNKDNILLEQTMILLSQSEQKLVRSIIKRLQLRDTRDSGKRIASFAAGVFLLENEVDVSVETKDAKTQGKPAAKGQKAGEPTVTTTTTTKTRAGTDDDMRVKFLRNLVARVEALMPSSQGNAVAGSNPSQASSTGGLTEEAAIDTVIDELEADGFISAESLIKRLEKIVKTIEEAKIGLYATILEARLVLSATEYKAVVAKVKQAAKSNYPKAPDTIEENSSVAKKKAYANKKAYYEEELRRCLISEMEVKTSNYKPKSKKLPSKWRLALGAGIIAFIILMTLAQLASR